MHVYGGRNVRYVSDRKGGENEMEIANLLQPLGMESSAAVAAGTAMPSPPVPDGAFAQFFAQMLGTAMPALSPETQQPELSGEMVDEAKEEPVLLEAGPEKKAPEVSAALATELQALALMNAAPQPVPVAPLPQPIDQEEPRIEGVPATPVTEMMQVKTAPVVLPSLSSADTSARQTAVPETASAPTSVRPVAEAAPQPVENGSVETAPLPPQKEAGTVPKEVITAAPVRETEGSPKPALTAAPTSAPVADAKPASDPRLAKAAPADEGATGRHQLAAAEGKRPEQAPVIEESAEAVVATEETVVKPAVKEASLSGSTGQDQPEQHLAPQGKEVPAQPVTAAHEPVRETERLSQPAATALAEKAPESEHEHIMLQVKEKLAVHSFRGGNDQISFTLHPEELGELKIMMRMDDQRLRVEIIAQNQTVKEALMQNLEGLKETLSKQSITVDRFDVNTGGGTFNQAFHEGRHTGRERNFQPYPQFGGGLKEPEQKNIVTAWLPRENSLVDVRF